MPVVLLALAIVGVAEQERDAGSAVFARQRRAQFWLSAAKPLLPVRPLPTMYTCCPSPSDFVGLTQASSVIDVAADKIELAAGARIVVAQRRGLVEPSGQVIGIEQRELRLPRTRLAELHRPGTCWGSQGEPARSAVPRPVLKIPIGDRLVGADDVGIGDLLGVLVVVGVVLGWGGAAARLAAKIRASGSHSARRRNRDRLGMRVVLRSGIGVQSKGGMVFARA